MTLFEVLHLILLAVIGIAVYWNTDVVVHLAYIIDRRLRPGPPALPSSTEPDETGAAVSAAEDDW